jgi:hypothetical protein
MEAVPFRSRDAANDVIRGILGWDLAAKANGYEKTVSSTLMVDGLWDFSGGFPGFGIDILVSLSCISV